MSCVELTANQVYTSVVETDFEDEILKYRDKPRSVLSIVERTLVGLECTPPATLPKGLNIEAVGDSLETRFD
jgi:hypothetical protein